MQTPKKKLAIHKETLRQLSPEALRQVQGGCGKDQLSSRAACATGNAK